MKSIKKTVGRLICVAFIKCIVWLAFSMRLKHFCTLLKMTSLLVRLIAAFALKMLDSKCWINQFSIAYFSVIYNFFHFADEEWALSIRNATRWRFCMIYTKWLQENGARRNGFVTSAFVQKLHSDILNSVSAHKTVHFLALWIEIRTFYWKLLM